MAYYNHIVEAHKKEAEDKYNELKKHITSVDDNGKMNEFVLAHRHMLLLESKIETLEKNISEYQKFFNTLDSFLPKSSINNNLI